MSITKHHTWAWKGELIVDMSHSELLKAAHEMCEYTFKLEEEVAAWKATHGPVLDRASKEAPFTYVKDRG